MSRSKRDILSGLSKPILFSAKVANNTFKLGYQDGSTAIRLHDTDIIRIMEKGQVILDSGGWKTVTTKARFNSFLGYFAKGFSISQEKGVWYLFKGQDRVCRFEDGMEISGDGKVTGGSPITNGKTDRAFKRKVRKYAELCAAAVPIDKPDAGDCFFCLMKTEKGQTLGDATKNKDHLISHMEEGYIVPSLVAEALKECYNAPMAFWTAFKDTSWTGNREFGKRAVRHAVYRFVLRRFGYSS